MGERISIGSLEKYNMIKIFFIKEVEEQNRKGNVEGSNTEAIRSEWKS